MSSHQYGLDAVALGSQTQPPFLPSVVSFAGYETGREAEFGVTTYLRSLKLVPSPSA